MLDNSTNMRLDISSSSTSLSESLATTTATTPELSQSRRESEHDIGDAAVPASSTAVNAAKVSSKLSTLEATTRAAATAVPFIIPGSDEGHPIDPLLRIYDPSKDDNLSIEELLARPRLPRAPSERVAMAKLKAQLEVAKKDMVPVVLTPEEELVAAEVKKADRQKYIRKIMAIADELNVTYAKRK